MQERNDRLPLPSEDSGDLVDEPASGMTDDPMVATEEGVPYTITLVSNGHSWRWHCACGASSSGRRYRSREEAATKARRHTPTHLSDR